MKKFAINGFGRIGRAIVRSLFEHGGRVDGLQVINCGIGDIDTYLHLLRYDSVHGVFHHATKIGESKIKIADQEIEVIFETDPSKIDWKKYGVEIIVEATGQFTTRELASKHLKSGASKVIITAPAKDVDATVVYGVNNQVITEDADIISAGSCTTNCLAPPLKALLDTNVKIQSGFMTTIHAYTNDQNLVDAGHNDLRRARAAAVSMIPSSTGAAKAIGLVLPELNGKMDGVAVRVPVPNVSMIDVKLVLESDISVKEVHSAIKEFSATYPNILSYEKQELVSIDYNHSVYSSIFDATQTKVVEGNLLRFAAWYDNEWGFSNRVLDILAHLSEM